VSAVDLRQLALLVTVHETQNLTEAARRLHMTPSAASQSLQRLRDALGDQILIRQGANYVPTPFGEGALDAFRDMLQLWAQAGSGGAVFDPASSDARWTLACDEEFTEIDLDACYASIVSAAPRLRLDMTALPEPTQAWAALRAGRIDVLLTTAVPPADADDLHAERFPDARFTHCCLSVAHPRVVDALDLAGFAGELHVRMGLPDASAGAVDAVDEALLALGLAPRRCSVVPTLGHWAAILATTDRLGTVTAHQGAVLMRKADGLRLMPLPAELKLPPVPRHLVWHHRTHATDGHRWLRARLRSFVFTGPDVAPGGGPAGR
jgi:LysR family nod box-dependent transcriptional activator